MNYRISVGTHIGNVRTVNQDNFYCLGHFRDLKKDKAGFGAEVSGHSIRTVAIFDGMGGEKDGEIASLIAAKLTKDRLNEDPHSDIGDLIMLINSDICREMSERKCHMGSTCVFIEFDDERVRSWNIGDSRAYLYHGGELTQMTEDHTESAFYGELFKGESAERYGSENRLTQNLGIPEDDFVIEPYISSWETVRAGDLILLCSDGLTHMAGDIEIKKVVENDFPTDKKVSLLIRDALELGGSDNVTVMLAEAF